MSYCCQSDSSQVFFFDTCRDFINIFSRKTSGFHRQAKPSELYFVIRKTFLQIDFQTRQFKLVLQPVNLHNTFTSPLTKPLHLLTSLRGDLSAGFSSSMSSVISQS